MNEAQLQRALLGGSLGLAGAGLAGAGLSHNQTSDKLFGAMTLAGLLGSAGASKGVQKLLRDQHVFSAEGRQMKRELSGLKNEHYKDPFEERLAQIAEVVNGKPTRRGKPVETMKPTDPKMHADRIAELKGELAALHPETVYNRQLGDLQRNVDNGELFIKNNPTKSAEAKGLLDEHLAALNKHVTNKDRILKDIEAGNFRRSRQLLGEIQQHQSHLDNLMKPRQVSPEEAMNFLGDKLSNISARDAGKNLLLGSGLGALAGGYLGYNRS